MFANLPLFFDLGAMMDLGFTAAIITAMAGLIIVFFGKPFFGLFRDLIKGDQEEMLRLHAEISRLTTLTNDLRARIDQIESESHKKDIEIERLRHRLDDYVASSQYLTNENNRLQAALKATKDVSS